MVQFLATVAEFDQACASTNLTVIDFTATWCPPCQMIGPKFVAMAGEAGFSGVTFVKLDVDANDQASAKAGITCMPTFQCYKGGAKVDQLEGADENALRAMITKNM
jgi:thiol-disulfide isomerase/thioredoxin